jgi:hypothetical protein
MKVYVVVEGFYSDWDYRIKGIFSSLEAAQNACPENRFVEGYEVDALCKKAKKDT